MKNLFKYGGFIFSFLLLSCNLWGPQDDKANLDAAVLEGDCVKVAGTLVLVKKKSVSFNADCVGGLEEPARLKKNIKRFTSRDIASLDIYDQALFESRNNPNLQRDCDAAKLEVELEKIQEEAKSLLFQAAKQGDYKKIVEIIKNGFSVDVLDEAGKTALYYAVHENKNEVARKLLFDYSANVHAGLYSYYESPDGQLVSYSVETPLHVAVRKGNVWMIELLLDNHADVNEKNSNGETPIDIANKGKRKKHIETLELLEKADPNRITQDIALSILKLKTGATKEEILKAYEEQAFKFYSKKYHPNDKVPLLWIDSACGVLIRQACVYSK